MKRFNNDINEEDELNEFPNLKRLKELNNFKNIEVNEAFLSKLKEIPNEKKVFVLNKKWMYSAAAAAVLLGASIAFMNRTQEPQVDLALMEDVLILDDITLMQEYIYTE